MKTPLFPTIAKPLLVNIDHALLEVVTIAIRVNKAYIEVGK